MEFCRALASNRSTSHPGRGDEDRVVRVHLSMWEADVDSARPSRYRHCDAAQIFRWHGCGRHASGIDESRAIDVKRLATGQPVDIVSGLNPSVASAASLRVDQARTFGCLVAPCRNRIATPASGLMSPLKDLKARELSNVTSPARSTPRPVTASTMTLTVKAAPLLRY